MFLPGFVFITFWNWKFNRKQENYAVFIWSIFISVLIHSFCTILHNIILKNLYFNEWSKILIYSIIAVVFANIISIILASEFFEKYFSKKYNRTIHSDILNDVINGAEKTILKIKLKGSNYQYIGTYRYREENGVDSRIAIIDYSVYDSDLNLVYDTCKIKNGACLILNIRDIELFEIMYDENSNIWNARIKESG